MKKWQRRMRDQGKRYAVKRGLLEGRAKGFDKVDDLVTSIMVSLDSQGYRIVRKPELKKKEG